MTTTDPFTRAVAMLIDAFEATVISGWPPGMTLIGDGPEYQAYMQRWMKDHPDHWVLCPRCNNWRLTTRPDPNKSCPLCPSGRLVRAALKGEQ